MDTPSEIRTPSHTGIQFIKFCLVGGINTGIDLIIYVTLTRHLNFSGELIYVAKGISFILATLNSFFLNRLWTFRQTNGFQWTEFLKFYLMVGSGILMSVGIHFINIHFFKVHDILSAIISSGFTAIWNFTMTKKFIFK